MPNTIRQGQRGRGGSALRFFMRLALHISGCDVASSSASRAHAWALYDRFRDLLGIVVLPLDLHLVNVGTIPTGPTHGEGRLQPHPGDVLKSTPNVRKSPRSGLNLEGRLSDPQNFAPRKL